MCDELLFGVREDFMNLITTHASKNSLDFKDFVTTWRELKFYYIFSGRSDVEEMKFFMEHVLMLAKDLFLREGADKLEKTAALFLLHVLYVNQPLIKPMRIRIEHKELKEMRDFTDGMKNEAKDVPYAFYFLLFQDAFEYVYSYLKRFAEKTGVVDIRDQTPAKVKTTLKRLQQVNASDLLTEIGFDTNDWIQLEAVYNAEMEQLKADKIIPDNLKEHNFMKELQAEVNKLSGGPVVHVPRPSSGVKKVRLETRIVSGDGPRAVPRKPSEPAVQKSSKSLPLIFDGEDPDDSLAIAKEEKTSLDLTVSGEGSSRGPAKCSDTSTTSIKKVIKLESQEAPSTSKATEKPPVQGSSKSLPNILEDDAPDAFILFTKEEKPSLDDMLLDED